ncbi:MAG: DUF3239 domain-containing protein [Roseburia sp.]|nr:DUF3239 domain-containing protein [Roseburia sp.]
MVDYSQFEASTKSKIQADAAHIKTHDEIIGAVLRQRKSSKIIFVFCVCFLVLFAYLKLWIPTAVCGLFALFFLWRGTGKISEEYMKEVYEEGLLVPGMIVKTQPLTIMAIANLVAQEDAETINGCYNLVVKNLDGAKKELYEKVPCSCFFRYEGGSHHSAFQPHPLYWGTSNRQEITSALMQVEEDNKENSRDEWEVIKEIAEKFPDLKNGEIILMDENYVPFGRKDYLDSNYKPLNEE